MKWFPILLAPFSLVAVEESKKDSLYFPPAEGDWQSVDPAKLGWDLAKLKETLAYVGENKSSGFVILHRGRILAERYWPLKPTDKSAAGGLDPYFHMRLGENANGRPIEDVASVQKSVTAMLVGIAQTKGLLKLDDPVAKHLGKGWSQAPAESESKITIRHLVTMTSGLDSRLKFRVPAGTNWFYNTAAYSRALSCVAKASKMDPNEFTRKWLTEPAGMKDTRWAVRPWQASVRKDANRYGFATTARDLARFGLLMLANGHWGEQDVLQDKAFLRAATSPSQKLNPSYGYLWWLNGGPFTASGKRVRPGRLISAAPKDMYVAQGKLVRRLYVLPTQQIVIARLGDQANTDFNSELFRKLRLASGK